MLQSAFFAERMEEMEIGILERWNNGMKEFLPAPSLLPRSYIPVFHRCILPIFDLIA